MKVFGNNYQSFVCPLGYWIFGIFMMSHLKCCCLFDLNCPINVTKKKYFELNWTEQRSRINLRSYHTSYCFKSQSVLSLIGIYEIVIHVISKKINRGYLWYYSIQVLLPTGLCPKPASYVRFVNETKLKNIKTFFILKLTVSRLFVCWFPVEPCKAEKKKNRIRNVGVLSSRFPIEEITK